MQTRYFPKGPHVLTPPTLGRLWRQFQDVARLWRQEEG